MGFDKGEIMANFFLELSMGFEKGGIMAKFFLRPL